MRSLLALSMAVLLGLSLLACGGTGKGTGSAPGVSANAATSGVSAAPSGPQAAATQRYLNDGDAEKKNDHDNDNSNPNHEDGDLDSSEEYEDTFDNRDYHDSDDGIVLNYGHAANAADTRAIAIEAKRYYAAAAADNGKKACSMMTASDAGSVAEDYGSGAGPAYLRGGKTCEAVMSRLFEHSHAKLTGAIDVTGVRVKEGSAYALIGSTKLPASLIILKHEGGAWKINSLLGGALP
jgi:hypothetical protein